MLTHEIVLMGPGRLAGTSPGETVVGLALSLALIAAVVVVVGRPRRRAFGGR